MLKLLQNNEQKINFLLKWELGPSITRKIRPSKPNEFVVFPDFLGEIYSDYGEI